MRVFTSIDGLLQSLSGARLKSRDDLPKVVTGFAAIDRLLPGEGFTLGAVHEVLSETEIPSLVLPILVARSAAERGWIVWCDPLRRFNPPGAAALGLPLERVVVLRPANETEQIWAATESLRCAGVAACVIAVSRLTAPQSRRLQLAAERGGGIGLLLRSIRAAGRPYAAATRWLVRPAPGERRLQRLMVELIHGHGGRVGQNVLLEICRETHHVRAIETVANRTGETKTTAASA